MMRIRILLLCLAVALCCQISPNALSEATGEAFSFHGTRWGMPREEVRSLLVAEPIQEPTAETGHFALVYQTQMYGVPCIIQYSFLPSDVLYNITILAPDAEKALYQATAEAYTALYGEPLTEADASMESEDPAAVMLAAMMRSSGDTDYLGWNADEETVIVLSFEPTFQVSYVEIRRYTDFFQFSTDSE